MTPKRDLYDLIHSLTEGECNRLKRYLSSQKCKLFTCILNQAEFNNGELQKAMSEVKPHLLPSLKSKLYSDILEILTRNRPRQDRESHLFLLPLKIKILIGKSLYSQAETLISRAKSLAQELEAFEMHIRMIRLEREVWAHYRTSPDYLNKLNVSIQDETSIREKASELNTLQILFDRSLAISRLQGSGRHGAIMQIQENPELQPDRTFLSVLSEIQFLRIHIQLARLKGQDAALVALAKRAQELLQANSKLLGDPSLFLVYVKLIYTQGAILLHVKQYEEGAKVIAKLSETEEAYRQVVGGRVSIRERVWALKMLKVTQQGDTKVAQALFQEVEKGLKDFRGKINPAFEVTLRYQMAVFSVYAQDFKRAAKLIVPLRQLAPIPVKPRLVSFAWILNLIIKFEQKDYEAIHQALEPTKRFLKKHHLFAEYHDITLKFFRRLTKAVSKEDQRKEFIWYQSKITPLGNNPEFLHIANAFEIELWIESHISGNNLMETIREKYQT